MTRFEAVELLLDALKRNDPEDYARFRHELLRAFGYGNIQDAFDDALERGIRIGSKVHRHKHRPHT